MADQYTQQDPTTQYPQPNFGEQNLEHPGLERRCSPSPTTARTPTAAPAGSGKKAVNGR